MRCRVPAAWLLVASGMAIHAAPDPSDVLLVYSGDNEILAMPTTPLSAQSVRGVTLEVSTEGGFQVYRASHQGRTYTARSLIDGPPRQFAFDPRARRFTELVPLVRVRLKDAAALSDVAAAAGAMRQWHYPALGWAFLRLPADVNPAAVAHRLADHPRVERVEVQSAGPVVVPQ